MCPPRPVNTRWRLSFSCTTWTGQPSYSCVVVSTMVSDQTLAWPQLRPLCGSLGSAENSALMKWHCTCLLQNRFHYASCRVTTTFVGPHGKFALFSLPYLLFALSPHPSALSPLLLVSTFLSVSLLLSPPVAHIDPLSPSLPSPLFSPPSTFSLSSPSSFISFVCHPLSSLSQHSSAPYPAA